MYRGHAEPRQAPDAPRLPAPKAARLATEAEVYQALVTGTRDYVRKNGFHDVVIGLSGGIDSSLVAVVAADALGPEHVHGVSMPSRYSSEGSSSDAAALAANLGIDYRTVAIEPAHTAFLDMLAPDFAGLPPGLTEENLQSRIRGVILMALSNKLGWLVLTTGNKSEVAVGYSTLYGDTAGGFAVIKDVAKTLVYRLCAWRNRQGPAPVIPEEVLSKPPSAELRPDQRDDQSLPPYDVLDPALLAYVEDDLTAAEAGGGRLRRGTGATGGPPGGPGRVQAPANAARGAGHARRRSAATAGCRSPTATGDPSDARVSHRPRMSRCPRPPPPKTFPPADPAPAAARASSSGTRSWPPPSGSSSRPTIRPPCPSGPSPPPSGSRRRRSICTSPTATTWCSRSASASGPSSSRPWLTPPRASSDPWERIRRRGYAYLHWGLDNPEHYRILMTSRPDHTPERLLDERLADTAGLVPAAEDIAAAVAAGQIGRGGRPQGDHQGAVDDDPRHGVAPDLQAGVPLRSGRRALRADARAGLPGPRPPGPERRPCCSTRPAAWSAVTCWAESRLFEILGGWVASTDEPEAKLLFDRHSQHHAWRAQQWWDRLPVLADVERDGLIQPPTPAAAAAAVGLAGLDSTVPRLAGAYRVALPRLVAAYHGHRLRADPTSDGSVIRTLDLLLSDVVGDWREGEVFLQLLLTDEAAVGRAAAAVASLERISGRSLGTLVAGQRFDARNSLMTAGNSLTTST